MNPLIQLKYENTTETAPPSKAEQRAKRDTFHFCTDHTFYDMANTGGLKEEPHHKDLRHE